LANPKNVLKHPIAPDTKYEIQIFTHAVENNKIALLKGNVSS
jgi:hypothetical protein